MVHLKIFDKNKEPYPLLFSVKSRLITVLGFGFFTFLFLYIFRPFHIDTLEHVFTIIVGFSLLTMLVIFLTLFVAPLIFLDFFNPKKWTKGKMFLLVMINLFFVGVVNWSFFFFFL